MGTEYNSDKTLLLTSEPRQLCGEYRTMVTDWSSIDDVIIELTRNSDSTVVASQRENVSGGRANMEHVAEQRSRFSLWTKSNAH